MSKKIIKHDQPCLDPTCGSHDARQVYEDGNSFCFSCQRFFRPQDGEDLTPTAPPPPSPPQKKRAALEDIPGFPTKGFPEWGISKEVCEFFNVKVSFSSSDGTVDTHYYPYDGGKAYKCRKLPKEFTWIDKITPSLFGKELFSGGGKRLIICEGEKDVLSVAQAMLVHYKKIYPVVGLSSSAMAEKSLLPEREWLRSFKEVIWCGDEDEPGYKARATAVKIIGIDKIKLVKLPENDANDVLQKHGPEILNRCIWDAAPYVPAGIIGKEDLKERLRSFNSKQSVPYPPFVDGLNHKLKGHRGGEITLFVSGTGSGKSTLLREDMLWLKETTKDKIGVVSLEESPEETARKLAGMMLNRNPAKEEIPFDELEKGFDQVFADDRFVVLDHQGSITDHSIMDQLEYMCLVGCKYIYVDHITILVSEGSEGLTGNEAIDKVMNDMLRLVKKFPDVWLGLVSHLRKAQPGGKSFEEGKMPSLDDIKGSGSIKQVSFDIVAFCRNLVSESEIERNTTKYRVLKCRYTGLTGDVPGTVYDYDTGRLRAAPSKEFVEL